MTPSPETIKAVAEAIDDKEYAFGHYEVIAERAIAAFCKSAEMLGLVDAMTRVLEIERDEKAWAPLRKALTSFLNSGE